MTTIIDYKNTLLDQFEALKQFPMFQRMARTVEGSPWHREANVLVHTEMVVDEYVRLTDETLNGAPWSRNDYLGGMACVFHDTGKPSAEIEKYSEARGKYRAYHGHELLSARKWESYAAERGMMFSAEDIAKVSFYIEHHMPWSLENAEKLSMVARTAIRYNQEVFMRALMSDQRGRISDDRPTNLARCEAWLDNFKLIIMEELQTSVDRAMNQEEKPMFYMPIAPSGAGKSTYLKRLQERYKAVSDDKVASELTVFSLDALRHEFYDADDYAKAYEGSVKDKSFEARANARFHEMVKRGKDMYIDNTNLSAKRRKFYLDIARKHGYQTIAILMPVALNTLLERQKTRGDKIVPDAAVKQQYKSLQCPLKGEFDSILVSDHNMKQHP